MLSACGQRLPRSSAAIPIRGAKALAEHADLMGVRLFELSGSRLAVDRRADASWQPLLLLRIDPTPARVRGGVQLIGV
jgi:hypothetical protein